MNPRSEAATTAPETTTSAGAPDRRPLREEDLLDLVWVADPQISPDGRRVAFTRVWVDRDEDQYRTRIWWADLDGGDARMLTNGLHDAQPRWSPDGRHLAFVRRSGPDQPPQLHVLPVDGGEARALTTLEKGAGSPAWSPDGRRIAFTSGTHPALDDPKRVKPKHEPARIVTRPVFRENNAGFLTDFDHLDHLWVVDAEGGPARPLTTGAAPDGPPRWSRDGRRVLFVSDRRAEPWFGHEESVLYAVDPNRDTPADTGALEVVIAYPGPVRAFAEAPDGTFAVLGKVHDATFHSYDQMDVLRFAGAWPMREAVRLNATRDHAFGEGVNGDQHPPRGGGDLPFAFDRDGRSVLALAAREGGSLLVRVDGATGEVRELTPRDRDVVCGSGSSDGGRWALTIGSLLTPGDLVALDLARGTTRTLHAPNQALLDRIALGVPHELRVPSFDGAPIHGWYLTPPDFDPARRYPLILQIHGGPHTAYGHGFFHEFHLQAGAGYVVLFVNPRGSTSYGEPFADVIQYRYPGDDLHDLMAAVDAMVERGLADPARLGVTGGSGGGLLTNWIIAKTDRFAAAATQRCVSDWSSMAWSSDFAFFTPFWFRRPPYEDPQEWLERSPVRYAADITTPLMVIHSEEDWRTPIAQGETMFRALKQQGRTAVMIRFPGENHELTRSGLPAHRVENQQHLRAWFDHWLQGVPAPQYGL